MAERPAGESSPRDPQAYARLLKDVHDAVLSGVPAPRSPRSIVSASWNRSLAAHVDPDTGVAPLVYDSGEVNGLRDEHPLAPVLPILRQTLVSIADDAEHMMIVTDAAGHILWREGAAGVLRRADDVMLAEGTRWSEDVIGTNAMGTTLATGEPVQIYSAEHLVRTYHGWTCAAAPVRDPETGALLGSIDVSGPLRTVHPAMLALVTAAAQLAEGQLRARLAMRDERLRAANMTHLEALRGAPGALLSAKGRVLAAESCGDLPSTVDIRPGGGAVTLPDGRLGTVEPLSEGYLLRLRNRGASRRPRLALEFLTDGPPSTTVDGREVPFTLRHAEILTLLALNPGGLSAERLALLLYGESGNPVTVRAEIHRLRTQLGSDIVQTRPYRLSADVDADFLRVRAALKRGDVTAAAEAFRGPLLAESESPAVREEREAVTASVRRVVLGSGDAAALWSYWETPCGADDLEIVDALCRVLPDGDPRRAVAFTHRNRLDR
ncbi:transcriptional regulator [Amycolatopsis sp. WAC 04169]|uniref:helix-turn-helix domain-containing protein n=1 Tax=Amycolatopsis sp. WAC 04169 TaxID=2203197 RepID=UPI000F7684F2|nr:helix-turn-helix domain-containing protein [Amycolatopsis sp. WAC 04169]RSN23402.1 transcriptional regulator [Amycolatopsis sp. WAC 04169]